LSFLFIQFSETNLLAKIVSPEVASNELRTTNISAMMDDNSVPQLTVIIPVRNEARFIDRCLSSIFSADPVAGGMEVLVIDGMSTDGTRQILAEWSRRHVNLHVLNNFQRIAATAMNIGIRAARGKWIMVVGAHCEYPADYFKLCLETGQRTNADNVGGGLITMSENSTVQGKLVRAMTTHRFGVGNAGCRIGAPEGRADTVAYSCYRREVFERIGFYDERLVRNQDYELNCRLLKTGGSIWFNPAIQAQYYNQGTIVGLIRQAFVTGQWNPWMWYIAPYSFAWRHAVPAGFVVALLIALLFSFIAPPFGLAILTLILVAYFLLGVLSSVQQSLRYGIWMLPVLPFLFFAYHLAYGLGGLLGIFLLCFRRAPVQLAPEPWPGAGSYRPWPKVKRVVN
jgi:succinoglycan biosynthesis protein ExoA